MKVSFFGGLVDVTNRSIILPYQLMDLFLLLIGDFPLVVMDLGTFLWARVTLKQKMIVKWVLKMSLFGYFILDHIIY